MSGLLRKSCTRKTFSRAIRRMVSVNQSGDRRPISIPAARVGEVLAVIWRRCHVADLLDLVQVRLVGLFGSDRQADAVRNDGECLT